MMSTYQNYHDAELEITPSEANKFLRILFTALFVTAVFIVPTIGAIKFLFF
jgi:hypothetical protein